MRSARTVSRIRRLLPGGRGGARGRSSRSRSPRLPALLPALALVVTAACTGGGGGGPESLEDVDWDNPEGTIRVTWWGADTRNEKHNFVNDRFEKAFPEVTLQRESGDFDPHWEKLTVQTAARDEPCVPQMQSRYMMEYAPRGTLMPLDDIVGGKDAPIDVSGIPQVLLDGGRGADGNLYMVPYGVFFFVMMYNEDYLKQAGLEPPSIDWTWDDYFQMMMEAKDKLPDGVWPTQPRGGDPETFFAYVQSQGQKVFDGQSLGFDKQLLIDWMRQWERLRKAGATMPMDMAAEEPDALEESWLATGRLMMDRKAANQLDAHQVGLDATEGRAGTFRMQKHPNGPEGAGDDLGTNGWSIGANCDNPSAAAAFINFFTNDVESADYYASDNGVVTVDSLRQRQLEDPDTAPGQKRQLELFEQVAEVAPEPVLYPSGYLGVLNALERSYEEVAFGRASIREAVDTFFSESETLLREVEG